MASRLDPETELSIDIVASQQLVKEDVIREVLEK